MSSRISWRTLIQFRCLMTHKSIFMILSIKSILFLNILQLLQLTISIKYLGNHITFFLFFNFNSDLLINSILQIRNYIISHDLVKLLRIWIHIILGDYILISLFKHFVEVDFAVHLFFCFWEGAPPTRNYSCFFWYWFWLETFDVIWRSWLGYHYLTVHYLLEIVESC